MTTPYEAAIKASEPHFVLREAPWPEMLSEARQKILAEGGGLFRVWNEDGTLSREEWIE